MNISDDVSEALKSYAYVYVALRKGEPFSLRKEKGDRLFSRLDIQVDIDQIWKRKTVSPSAQRIHPNNL